MNRNMVFGACVAVFVTGGLIWRARRSTEGSALMQFAGGLNVFAAALLLAIGTVVHGSVTFYMPVLVWLGLLSDEATALLPWLAIFTLPLACVCWAVGMALIVDAGSDKRVQELRIKSQ